MTHVEKMRFQAALQALRGTNPVLFPCLPSTALTSVLRQRKAKQQQRELSECLRAARVRREERMDNQRNAFPYRGACTRRHSRANTRPGPAPAPGAALEAAAAAAAGAAREPGVAAAPAPAGGAVRGSAPRSAAAAPPSTPAPTRTFKSKTSHRHAQGAAQDHEDQSGSDCPCGLPTAATPASRLAGPWAGPRRAPTAAACRPGCRAAG